MEGASSPPPAKSPRLAEGGEGHRTGDDASAGDAATSSSRRTSQRLKPGQQGGLAALAPAPEPVIKVREVLLSPAAFVRCARLARARRPALLRSAGCLRLHGRLLAAGRQRLHDRIGAGGQGH